jgi:hypothetical protein
MALKLQGLALSLMPCLFLTGCAPVIVPVNDPSYFPMTRGTQWSYETHSEVCRTGGGVVTNNTVILCEVIDAYAKGTVTAARLRGFPLEMDVWAGCTNHNDESLLVCIPGSQYHLLGTNAISRFFDTNDILFELVNEDSLFLDCPLAADKRFGEFKQLTRDDRLYSWHVESEEQCRIRGIQGISPWRQRTAYHLVYRTLPDVVSLVFVPGIGIVEYVYHHNGTPCDVRMCLKTFKNPD